MLSKSSRWLGSSPLCLECTHVSRVLDILGHFLHVECVKESLHVRPAPELLWYALVGGAACVCLLTSRLGRMCPSKAAVLVLLPILNIVHQMHFRLKHWGW